MKFEDTGLKSHKLIKQAFEIAYADNRYAFMAYLNDQYIAPAEQQLRALEAAKNQGRIPEDKYPMIKAQYEARRDQIKEQVRVASTDPQQLDQFFTASKLCSIRELQNTTDKPSPELIASALVFNDTLRDPVLFKKIEEKLGAAIGTMLAEILHIQSHPRDAGEANPADYVGTPEDAQAAASPDVKRFLFNETVIHELAHFPEKVEAYARQGATYIFAENEEEKVLSQAKLFWGNDKKQDARLTEVFNKAAEASNSPYRIEEYNNAPVLSKNASGNATPTNTTPVIANPTSSKPKSKGDDMGFF